MDNNPNNQPGLVGPQPPETPQPGMQEPNPVTPPNSQPPSPESNPFQPVQAQTPPPISTPQPAPAVAGEAVASNTLNPEPKKSVLPIWALILSIVGLITGVVVFISLPLALVALILGIVALKKHARRKKMSVASVIISAFTLVVVVPIMLVITLVAYNGITTVANRAVIAAENQQAGDRFVDEACFTFTAPVGFASSQLFSQAEAGSDCTVLLAPNQEVSSSGSSSDFEFIAVSPLTEDVSTAEKAQAYIDENLNNDGFDGGETEVSTVNGYTLYSVTSNSEGTFVAHIIIDETGIHNQEGIITGYGIIGRTDTEDRKAALQKVLSTFIIKTEA